MLQKEDINNLRAADWQDCDKTACRQAVGRTSSFKNGEVITVIGQQLPELLATDTGIQYAMYDTADGRQVSYKMLFRPSYVPKGASLKAGDEVSKKLRVMACLKAIGIDYIQAGKNRIPVLREDTKLTVTMVRGHKADFDHGNPETGCIILGEEEDIPTFK